jgi:hypothetical protein
VKSLCIEKIRQAKTTCNTDKFINISVLRVAVMLIYRSIARDAASEMDSDRPSALRDDLLVADHS